MVLGAEITDYGSVPVHRQGELIRNPEAGGSQTQISQGMMAQLVAALKATQT